MYYAPRKWYIFSAKIYEKSSSKTYVQNNIFLKSSLGSLQNRKEITGSWVPLSPHREMKVAHFGAFFISFDKIIADLSLDKTWKCPACVWLVESHNPEL